MKLELHIDASKNFNEEANDLISKFSTIPSILHSEKGNSFRPDRPISFKIEDKDIIGEFRLNMLDSIGNIIAKVFGQNGQLIGLYDENYEKLAQLSQKMQKTKELCEKVSATLLTDLIFDWMKEKYRNAIELTMTEYVLRKCEEKIEEIEIWIPIATLYIESEIEIGHITLKTISREIFDRWRIEMKNDNIEINNKINELLDKDQKKCQGLAIATLKLCAEPLRAFEIAFEETEKSIDILRFFSPANFHPESSSHCIMLGRENLESVNYWIIKDNKLPQPDIHLLNSHFIDKSNFEWIVNNELLNKMRNSGLDILSNLLIKDGRTEFEEKLLDSILLYSKSSLSKNITDKLVYIFAALESILLKDTNEVIQHNVGERMAFLTHKSKDKRRDTIKIFKEVYKLRSKFLHHGYNVESEYLKLLIEFMIDVWSCFSNLIRSINRFETKEQLIDKIEDMKLS